MLRNEKALQINLSFETEQGCCAAIATGDKVSSRWSSLSIQKFGSRIF